MCWARNSRSSPGGLPSNCRMKRAGEWVSPSPRPASRPSDRGVEAMRLGVDTAEVFVPDGLPVEAALARTTHLGIGAHQDDLEIMAIHGILSCFHQKDHWFTGVVVTDGGGKGGGKCRNVQSLPQPAPGRWAPPVLPPNPADKHDTHVGVTLKVTEA